MLDSLVRLVLESQVHLLMDSQVHLQMNNNNGKTSSELQVQPSYLNSRVTPEKLPDKDC